MSMTKRAAVGLTASLAATFALAQPAATTANGQETVLGTVKVKDTATSSTENSGSYTTPLITIGKGAKSIRELPHSISVITRQRLDDQNINTIPEALKYTTGVNVQRFDGAGLFNNYYVRGYQIDTLLLDGLPVSNTGNVTEFDAGIYDRIEVLKGPAGLYQGAGEPSAALNLARKRAQRDTQVKGAINVGSWDAYRLELDATGALTADGKVRGRVVVVGDERDSYQDVIESDKRVIYATVEYDVTPATTLSMGATYQEYDSVIDQGLPTYRNGALLHVPRSTFIGADWNKLDTEATDVFVELEHHLAGGGLLKMAVRHLDRLMEYRVARANRAVQADGSIDIQTGIFTPDRENWSFDTYADLPFELFGQQHNFIAGMDMRESIEVSRQTPFVTTGPDMNINNIDHALPQPSFAFTTKNSTDVDQSGVYTQLRLRVLEPLSIIGGGRLSWWESTGTNELNGSRTSYFKATREFTPYWALVYDATKNISVYGSYADIFQPQNAITPSAKQIEPRTGKQYEVGAKGEFAEGRLNAQIAAFRIVDENRALPAANPNPNLGVSQSVASGKVRSKGWEFEISGQITPQWDMTLGYTRVETQYLEAAAAQDGQSFAPFTPRHSASLWTHYTFKGALDGFSAGGGVRALSSFYQQATPTADNPTGLTSADSYSVISLQAGYQFNPRLSANLTLNNLLDENYYEKISGSTRQNFYGEPRSLTLAIRAALF